jgi:predicted nucleic acid-binding protein
VRSSAGPVESERAGLVVDASVAAAWCFEDEASPYTDGVLERVARSGAHVPAVWPFEMASVLVVALRRERIDADRAGRFLDALLALPTEVDRREAHLLLPSLTRVAGRYGLSAYDAAYLELAMRSGLAIATTDARLVDAARQAGVVVFGT